MPGGERPFGAAPVEHEAPAVTSRCCVAAHIASASAIAGTRSGRTKLVTSKSRIPAATSASAIATFASVLIGASSCSPSRRLTSRTRTEAGSLLITFPFSPPRIAFGDIVRQSCRSRSIGHDRGPDVRPLRSRRALGLRPPRGRGVRRARLPCARRAAGPSCRCPTSVSVRTSAPRRPSGSPRRRGSASHDHPAFEVMGVVRASRRRSRSGRPEPRRRRAHRAAAQPVAWTSTPRSACRVRPCCCPRAPCVANRGSSARSGRPIAVQRRRYTASAFAATMMLESSAVG